MARHNNILPKGAGPHLSPPHAPRDPSAADYNDGYEQPYDPAHGGHGHPQPGAPRDIFNALRPDSLASRLDPLAAAGRGHGHDGFGRTGYEQGGQAYPSQGGGYTQGHQGYDPYGQQQHSGYHDGGAGHDPSFYGDPAADPMQRYQQGQGYAPHPQQYGQEDPYTFDDPYRADPNDPYGASPEVAAEHGADGEYYGEEYAEEPEARRGPRAVVVVGALIGAIALGGGLAYGYKSIANGGSDSGKLPILRADSAPAKAQPTDPGGKQMAHTDKKFLNRLTEERGASRPGPVPVSILPPSPEREPSVSEGGPRRVPTMVVGRDGSISPTSSGPDTAPPPRVTGVPGMVIEGLTPRRPPPPTLREEPAPAPERAAPIEEAAPVTPRRIASASASVAAEPPPAPPAPRASPEAKRPVPTTRQAARTSQSAAPAAPTSSGYVAVLSSRKSHMDALKSFADIQQKYSSVLQGRTPDVREADLGEKGVWYRVVVGPPGSRDAANTVCGQLKSQGYVGCWIMAY